MSKTVFLACLVMLLAAVSCKKEDQTTDYNPTVPDDYTNLKVGNFWIYKFYRIDSSGVEHDLDETDSAYISGDTVINGKLYFVRSSSHLKSGGVLLLPMHQFLRDSSGYLVDHTGAILFSRDNFTDILAQDTIGGLVWSSMKMTGKDSLVTVPAGTLTTRSAGFTWMSLEPGYPYGIRRSFYIYAKNTGLCKYNYWFYSASWSYDARLVRYGPID